MLHANQCMKSIMIPPQLDKTLFQGYSAKNILRGVYHLTVPDNDLKHNYFHKIIDFAKGNFLTKPRSMKSIRTRAPGNSSLAINEANLNVFTLRTKKPGLNRL